MRRRDTWVHARPAQAREGLIGAFGSRGGQCTTVTGATGTGEGGYGGGEAGRYRHGGHARHGPRHQRGTCRGREHRVRRLSRQRGGGGRAEEEISRLSGGSFALKADLSLVHEARRAADEVVSRFGRIDILVNNAGVFDFRFFEDMTDEYFSTR